MNQKLELHQGLKIPVGSETVSATRYQPKGVEENLPALLMHFPYRKDDHHIFGKYSPIVEYLAENRYEVVVADMVGTGGSTGWKADYHESTKEGKEAAEIINWLAEQEWTNGRIGMFGKSYAGMMCLNAAAQKSDALEAIVPMYSLLSLNSDWRMKGGAINPLATGGLWHAQMQAFEALPPSYRDADGRWIDIWKSRLEKMRENPPKLISDLRTDFEEINQQHDHELESEINLREIDVPTLAVSGWRDLSPSSTIDIIRNIQGPKRAIIGPWRHTMPHRGTETKIPFLPIVVKWFDYFLKEIDNDVLSYPKYSFWTEFVKSDTIEGVWRGSGEISISNGSRDEQIAFSFSPDGLVQSSEFDGPNFEANYDVDYSVGMASVDGLDFPMINTNSDDARSFYQETSELRTPIEFTGFGEMNLRVRTSNPDPTIGIRLLDVNKDGRAKLVSHGRLRPTNVKGYPNTLESDKKYSFRIPLKPKSHVFLPGHRIRVAISGSYFPIAIPSNQDGGFSIISSPSKPTRLKLSGKHRSSPTSFQDTVDCDQLREKKSPIYSEYVKDSDWDWETKRDHVTNSATFHISSQMSVDLPHAEEMKFSQKFTASANSSDPKAMMVRSTTEMLLDFGETSAKSLVHCRMSENSTSLSNQVIHDENTIFDQYWTI